MFIDSVYRFLFKDVPSDEDYFKWDFVTSVLGNYSNLAGLSGVVAGASDLIISNGNLWMFFPGLLIVGFGHYVLSKREFIKQQYDKTKATEVSKTVVARFNRLENIVAKNSLFSDIANGKAVDLTDYLNKLSDYTEH